MKFSEISIIDIFNFFVALASFIFAVIAFVISRQTEIDVADYEYTLSQTPKLCILNQVIQIPLQENSDINNIELDKSRSAVDTIYNMSEYSPIKIPIYNTGTGLAQNCKIEFSSINQKELALSCRDAFKLCGLNNNLNYGEISIFYDYETYLYNYKYIFYKENLLRIIWKRNSVTDVSNDFSKDYTYSYPYILPITDEKNDIFFEIPEEFSAIILEVMYREMDNTYKSSFEPIELEISVTYQDLKNNEYCHKYVLEFNTIPNEDLNSEPLLQIELEIKEIIEN